MGIKTAQQWYDHFVAGGSSERAQCSWNAEDPVQWGEMIEARKFPYVNNWMWNEVIIRNFPDGDGHPIRPYIAAVFYEVHGNRNGLEAAKAFQVKLRNAGYTVPIVKINYVELAATGFTYSADDQAIPIQ
jgi:hypothetical protein